MKMKKIRLYSGMIFSIMIIATTVDAKRIPAAGSTKPGKAVVSVTGPHASFDKIWVDYDIYEDNVKGMRIHVKFTTYEMKGMEAYLAIYYANNTERGGTLKDKNQKFN